MSYEVEVPAPVAGLDLRVVAEVKDAVAGVLSERRRQAAMSPNPAADEEEAAEAELLIWEELNQMARRRTKEKKEPLDPLVEQRIMERVRADLFGLGGFEPYLANETVEDIFVNGCDRVFVTRIGGGQVDQVDQIAESDDALIELINRWAARKGRTERRFDVANPRLNLKLPGGFRMHAIMEVTERPTITIRCPRHRDMTLAGQRELGTIDDRLARFLSAAVRARCNIIVSGGTGSGKTTLLRSLLFEVPAVERIVTIEDTTELGLSSFPDRHPNVVEMETRDANLEGVGEISMMDLTREVLRMSPDRVIVGEVRGAEALYMLKAMSQGNDGSMCSVHADSARGVAGRLRSYVAEGVANMPPSVTDSFFNAAVDLIVHLNVIENRRRVVGTVLEVEKSFDDETRYNELFAATPDGPAHLVGRPTEPLLARLLNAGMDEAVVREDRVQSRPGRPRSR